MFFLAEMRGCVFALESSLDGGVASDGVVLLVDGFKVFLSLGASLLHQ